MTLDTVEDTRYRDLRHGLPGREKLELSFETLQKLRHLEEKVIPLAALFQATLEIR
jgi:hypothetical protein